ncbi:unnamed protein product, partial [Mesorhabditis spiculigera]
MLQLQALINAPLMVMFNKTSSEIFGINDGGTLLLSAVGWMGLSGMIVSLAVVVPLMDYYGRKPICVYVKFGMTTLGVSLFILSWIVQNGIFYLLGLGCIIIPVAVMMLGDIIFLSEIAPAQHRSFFATLSLSFLPIYGGVCHLLAREDVWGTPEKWGYIPILTLFLNLLMLIVGSKLPSGRPGLKDEFTLTSFYQQHFQKFRRVIVPKAGLGNKFLLVASLQLFLMTNIVLLEAEFAIPVYREEGMSVNSILTMTLVLFVILAPIQWLGPLLLNKLEKKKIFHIVLPLFLLKATLHIVNSELQIEALCYLNVLLTKTLEATGVTALPFVVATEILPQEYLVTVTQLCLAISSICISFFTSLAPFTFGSCLQYYLLFVVGFSALMATIARRNWKMVSEEIEGPEAEPLLRKTSPPPEYELLI